MFNHLINKFDFKNIYNINRKMPAIDIYNKINLEDTGIILGKNYCISRDEFFLIKCEINYRLDKFKIIEHEEKIKKKELNNVKILNYIKNNLKLEFNLTENKIYHLCNKFYGKPDFLGYDYIIHCFCSYFINKEKNINEEHYSIIQFLLSLYNKNKAYYIQYNYLTCEYYTTEIERNEKWLIKNLKYIIQFIDELEYYKNNYEDLKNSNIYIKHKENIYNDLDLLCESPEKIYDTEEDNYIENQQSSRFIELDKVIETENIDDLFECVKELEYPDKDIVRKLIIEATVEDIMLKVIKSIEEEKLNDNKEEKIKNNKEEKNKLNIVNFREILKYSKYLFLLYIIFNLDFVY